MQSTQLLESLGFDRESLPIACKTFSEASADVWRLPFFWKSQTCYTGRARQHLDTDMLAVLEDLLDSWPERLVVSDRLIERVTDDQHALIDGHPPRSWWRWTSTSSLLDAAKQTARRAGSCRCTRSLRCNELQVDGGFRQRARCRATPNAASSRSALTRSLSYKAQGAAWAD